jgi:hypothetical protein
LEFFNQDVGQFYGSLGWGCLAGPWIHVMANDGIDVSGYLISALLPVDGTRL